VEASLFRFDYVDADKLGEMILNGDVEEDLECPVCLIQLEPDDQFEMVMSDVIEIQEYCVKILNNQNFSINTLEKLKRALQNKDKELNQEVFHKQCFKIVAKELKERISLRK
jgi:hypothetical protein